jgi:hypothetical protein
MQSNALLAWQRFYDGKSGRYRELLGGCDADTGGETLVSTLQSYMKPLNNLVVISYHTPRKCVRVLISIMSISLSKDNNDSWGTCTTSVECRTVITAVLMVMSGMDPHMISGNLGWVFG